MASKNVKITVEFPEGMRKLNKQQADRLKEIFRSEFANALGADAADRLAAMDFENVTRSPSSKKPSSKKSVKGSSKKSIK